MSIDLEYAIKKDIRNNPVVREIDLQQKREFRRMSGSAAAHRRRCCCSPPGSTSRSCDTAISVEELRDEAGGRGDAQPQAAARARDAAAPAGDRGPRRSRTAADALPTRNGHARHRARPQCRPRPGDRRARALRSAMITNALLDHAGPAASSIRSGPPIGRTAVRAALAPPSSAVIVVLAICAVLGGRRSRRGWSAPGVPARGAAPRAPTAAAASTSSAGRHPRRHRRPARHGPGLFGRRRSRSSPTRSEVKKDAATVDGAVRRARRLHRARKRPSSTRGLAGRRAMRSYVRDGARGLAARRPSAVAALEPARHHAHRRDTRRYYPKLDLAAHVLGFVGDDNAASAASKPVSTRSIRGRERPRARPERRAQATACSTRVERAPTAGATLELTIDLPLQHIVERELKAGVLANRAAGGTAIVMDPHTGEILALANYPTFNPNAFGRASDDERRNRAIQDLYEPGSTFKIVTASAAIEEGVVAADRSDRLQPGLHHVPGPQADPRRAPVRRAVVRRRHRQVEQRRRDPGRPARRRRAAAPLRAPVRLRRARSRPTSPASRRASSTDRPSIDDSGLASVSMGYQIGVTPLQMAAAVSAVANGGLLMRAARRPRDDRATASRTAIEPKIAAPRDHGRDRRDADDDHGRRRRARHGEGRGARALSGRRQDRHRGQARRTAATPTADYNASFVGFVPSRRPALTILVVIDTPHAGTYLRRRRRRADLQAHRGSGAAAARRAADDQSGPPVIVAALDAADAAAGAARARLRRDADADRSSAAGR